MSEEKKEQKKNPNPPKPSKQNPPKPLRDRNICQLYKDKPQCILWIMFYSLPFVYLINFLLI